MKTEWNTRIVGALLLIMSVMFDLPETALGTSCTGSYGSLKVVYVCNASRTSCKLKTTCNTSTGCCRGGVFYNYTATIKTTGWEPDYVASLKAKLADPAYLERIGNLQSFNGDSPVPDDFSELNVDSFLENSLTIYASTFTNNAIFDLYGHDISLNNPSGLFFNNERIQGSGTITANTTINTASGHFSPGNSQGGIIINGNFENDGTLVMELGGPDNTQYDTISIAGNARLGGSLIINLCDDFVPLNNQEFRILKTTGSITGHFEWVSVPCGYAWEVLETTDAYTVKCKTHVPVAEAGEDISITCDLRSKTSIAGRATDAGSEASLTYQWFEEYKDADGTITRSPLMDAATSARDGDYYPCPLAAAKIAKLSLGAHTLVLSVQDSEESDDIDSMVLTITNNPPVIGILNGPGVYKIGSDILLSADVQDLDGDSVSYVWKDGANELFAGTKSTKCCGLLTGLPDQSFSTLGLGTHTLCLDVKDSTNATASACFTVEVIDTEAPKLAPEILGTAILWPAVHVMVPVTILAHASDNSGALASLKVSVTSNEPASGTSKYDLSPDYKVLSVNKATGVIRLLLRAESSPSGSGRQYTIAIQAKDISENISAASVVVRAPRGKPVICCQ